MKAIDRQFTKIVNGTTQFVIPVFQRDYSWSEAQCAQLWEDVVRVGKSNDSRGHFMGSLVYVPAGDTAAGFTRWLLIDGQQRLTTMTLLMIALRQHIKESGWNPSTEDGPTAKKIEAYFLKNLQEDGDRQYKLVLRRNDQVALCALLNDDTPPNNVAPRIVENFEFFKERMQGVDPATIYSGIGKLIVVDVTLDRFNDDPQMIFESLNSTGLDLSQADLIRNFILMRVPEAQQTKLYEVYWKPIEELFRGSVRMFDAFARDFMALQTKATRQARTEEIYHEFRPFFREREKTLGMEPALAEMLRFARYHAAFTLGRGSSNAFAAGLSRLNRLAEVAALVVMRLYECHDIHHTLPGDEFVAALELLESYVFRRAVCGMQTRGYWQVFASVAERISEKDPLRSLASQLHRLQRGSYRFPTDEEFNAALHGRDIYNTRTCHYLLDRLENHHTKEPSDTSRYTVEHIMPQNEAVPKAWREMLGPEWQAVHKAWLHRLGNLTLTGYNSTYSDRSFGEKNSIKGGFGESAVRLNKYVREQSKWTATEMEERGRALAKRSIEIWKPLVVSDDAVRQSVQEELRRLAAKVPLEKVDMTKDARALVELLRTQILAADAGIIEVPRARSVCYHAADGDFFAELLPRKRSARVLLNLEMSECEHRDDQLRDATEYKFLVNATNTGGVFYSVRGAEHIEGAMKLLLQAHALAAQ